MPPRTRKKKATATEPSKPAGVCSFGTCTRPAVVGDYCFGHMLTTRLARGAEQAERRGDVLQEALYRLLGTGAAYVADDPQRAAFQAQLAYQHVRAARQAAPPPPAKPDPFAVLHLDRATATVADVKRVQRRLAEIYHSDKGDAAVAGGAMAAINAAAQAAIEELSR